jgi:hypothetical protein
VEWRRSARACVAGTSFRARTSDFLVQLANATLFGSNLLFELRLGWSSSSSSGGRTAASPSAADLGLFFLLGSSSMMTRLRLGSRFRFQAALEPLLCFLRQHEWILFRIRLQDASMHWRVQIEQFSTIAHFLVAQLHVTNSTLQEASLHHHSAGDLWSECEHSSSFRFGCQLSFDMSLSKFLRSYGGHIVHSSLAAAGWRIQLGSESALWILDLLLTN